MRALVRRDPFVVEVRTAVALGIFDKGTMNGVRNQCFDSLLGHLASCLCAEPTTTPAWLTALSSAATTKRANRTPRRMIEAPRNVRLTPRCVAPAPRFETSFQ